MLHTNWYVICRTGVCLPWASPLRVLRCVSVKVPLLVRQSLTRVQKNLPPPTFYSYFYAFFIVTAHQNSPSTTQKYASVPSFANAINSYSRCVYCPFRWHLRKHMGATLWANIPPLIEGSACHRVWKPWIVNWPRLPRKVYFSCPNSHTLRLRFVVFVAQPNSAEQNRWWWWDAKASSPSSNWSHERGLSSCTYV